MAQPTDGSHKSSNAKSVSKTLEILSTFNESLPVQRTSDIANKLHMNISTVSRHLNTMLDWGFLERDETTGHYSLGLEIVALAGAALQNNAVYRYAYPELQQLSHQYGVHCHMGMPRSTDVVHLISLCCETTQELLIPVGHCQPMCCSAMGRALLAYLPQEEVQQVLAECEGRWRTPEAKLDLGELHQELSHTKQKGYCILFDEWAEGMSSLATPVFDSAGHPVAAIGVSTSAQNFSQPQRERELAKAVLTVAERLSCKLGYAPKGEKPTV